MRRLCVYYRLANKFIGKRIEWIVCKNCQRKLLKGMRLKLGYSLEAKHEVVDSVPTADLQRYVRTGEATPALEKHLGDVLSYPRMFGTPEPENQPDGFGTNN